ncbi:MAG TPA: fibronectin type III domain-containing protein [Ilumatobacteraceae bacterium]
MKVRSAVGGIGLSAISMVLIGVLPTAQPVHAASVVFVVNSTGDRDDAVVDGTCQTVTAGECTLRAALTEANAITASPVLINFAIPGAGVKRINVGTRLPLIDNGSAGITIDGFSQAGSAPNTSALVDNAVRLIEIVGTGPNGIDGLIFLGSNNVVKGVVIHGFKRAIRMTGKPAQFNIITGNIIGLLPNGDFDPTYADVTGSPCVDINNGASRNRIGMPGNANRNVISGCYEKGVTFYNQFTWKNYVQNNIIGLDPTGTQRRGSQSMGVDINWSANGMIIGGTALQERNVISGNVNSGVEVSHGTGTINNQVVGNFIGTDPTGNSASAATVNNQVGVRLEGKPDCGASACPPDESKETVTDNVIVNSGWGGILVDKGTFDSTIARNRIGTTANGTVVGNGTFDIRLAAGVTHITVGPGNIISGGHAGIQINPFGSNPASTVFSPTQDNTITQNSISNSAGLGIDILPYGTVNQNGSGDPGLQQGVDVPVLTAHSPSVTAQTCGSCTVELFGTSGAVGAFGPGNTYVSTAVADASGVATFAQPAAGWPAHVTATTRTPEGSTSEFAANIVATGPTAPTAPTNVVATAGVASAQVSFAASNANGSAITSYTVTAQDQTSAARGGQTASGAASPISITGLTNGDSYVFTVTATNGVGTGPASAPSNAVTPTQGGGVTATSMVPKALGQGATNRDVKLNGSGFAAGSTVAISGAGVSVKLVTFTSATVLTVKISVAANATVGPSDVTVTVPGNGSAQCAGCFVVSAGPTITSVSPNTVARGQAVPIDIVGTTFNTGATVTISGTGVTVGTVTRVDATHLRVTLTAASTATVGPRSLTVTNTDAGKVTSASDAIQIV